MFSSELEEELKTTQQVLLQKERVIKELSDQVESGVKARTENVKLKEQVQDHYEELVQLRKIEIVAERYRQKLEASQDAQTKLRVLQDENESLSQSLEELKEIESKRYQEEEYLELVQRVDQLEAEDLVKEQVLVACRHKVEEQNEQLEELRSMLNRTEKETRSASPVGEPASEAVLRQRVAELEEELEILRKGSMRGGNKYKQADIRSLIDHYEVLMRANTGGMGQFKRRPSAAEKGSFASTTSSSTTRSAVDWKAEACEAQQETERLKQELVLMSRAWHSLASRVQQQNTLVMKRTADTPSGWLNKQRRALDRLATMRAG